jgi:hypothetical protein
MKYRHSHFNALHLGDTSTFSCAFPVDKKQAEIKKAISNLPDAVDTALLVQGADEYFETNTPEGQIPLQPTATSVAMERITDSSRKSVMRSRHFVFDALTSGLDLKTAQLRVDREGSRIRELSLVCHGFDIKTPASIELRAVVNDPHEDVYELATYQNDAEIDSILLDPDTTGDFIHALREKQAGQELPELSIEAGLLELLEKSQDYSHYQSGVYTISTEKAISLKIAREQRIKRQVARACAINLELRETSFAGTLETARSFDLDLVKPSARLNYIIRSLDEEVSPEDRTAMFEEVSVYLRENPALLFSALTSAAISLNALESED